MALSSFSPEEKFIVSISGKGQHYCLLGLSRNDFCGCDAKREEHLLQGPDQDTDRTQKEFQRSSASQESNINLASAWQCKDRHQLEDSENYYEI